MRSIASFALITAGMAMTSACATANGQEAADNFDDKRVVTKVVVDGENRHVIRVGEAVEDVMKDKDTDGDGRISIKEYYTGPNQGRFDAIDADDNDYIDEAELTRTFEERFGRLAGRLGGHKWINVERSGDGSNFTIDLDGMDEEIEIRVREAHEQAEEAMAQVEIQMGHLRERMGDENFFIVAPDMEGFKLDKEEMAAMRDSQRARILEKLDANSDGTVSRDEFASRTNKKFDKLDKDEDGKLSGEELEGHLAFGAFDLPHLADGGTSWQFFTHDDDDEDEGSDEK